MEWRFKTPERYQQDNGIVVYGVGLEEPYIVPVDIVWNGKECVPDLSFETHIKDVQRSILEAVVKHPALFRSPPTLQSLQAITPVWGVVVREGGKLSWSPHTSWPFLPATQGKEGIVRMKLMGINISRQSILPVWGEPVFVRLVDSPPAQIDFCFDGEDDNLSTGSSAASTASEDGEEEDLGIEEDSEGPVFQLRDASAEKKEVKQRVRDLLQRASEARMAADVALERFFEEYDLSEGESDFSDDDV